VGYGPYVQPFSGSTLRDDGGDMVDTLYPVLSWLTWPLSIGKWTVEGIETRAQLLDSTVCCASLPIRTSWCVKRTSRIMTLLPTAVS
jgi:ABC-type transporter lipoprotein component MlaA